MTQQQIGDPCTVTPYIGNDGTVQLNLVQDVSDVTGTVTVDGNTQYIIGDPLHHLLPHREERREIIVLGGYQKQIKARGTSRLGPIPILGDLFGARTRDNFHQELVFFLRPTRPSPTPPPTMPRRCGASRAVAGPRRDPRSKLKPP